MRVRAYTFADSAWAEALLAAELGGRWQARLGELVDVLAYDGLVAEDDDGQRLGYLSYRVDGDECEIVAFVAAHRQRGIGTALLNALEGRVQGKKIWLVTTNDNLDALRFYQRRGFRIRAVRPGAVDESRRRLKPTIGKTGAFGIPLRDELELEK